MHRRRWGVRGGVVVLALVCFGGCSSRYWVRPSHLARAQQQVVQTGGDVAIPALSGDGEETYVGYESIREFEGVDPSSGLQGVVARDSRGGLRTTGWVFTSIGGVFLLLATPYLVQSDRSDDPGDEALRLILTLEAVVHLGVGVPLLLAGYVSDGPELSGPSPGMPTSLREP